MLAVADNVTVKLLETAPDTMRHTWIEPVLSSTEYPSGGASKLTAACGRRSVNPGF